jgi:hypothetical protein
LCLVPRIDRNRTHKPLLSFFFFFFFSCLPLLVFFFFFFFFFFFLAFFFFLSPFFFSVLVTKSAADTKPPEIPVTPHRLAIDFFCSRSCPLLKSRIDSSGMSQRQALDLFQRTLRSSSPPRRRRTPAVRQNRSSTSYLGQTAASASRRKVVPVVRGFNVEFHY